MSSSMKAPAGSASAPHSYEAAVHLAGDARARSVDLTSRPDRAEANLLYQRLGFNRRDTNVYRLQLDG